MVVGGKELDGMMLRASGVILGKFVGNSDDDCD